MAVPGSLPFQYAIRGDGISTVPNEVQAHDQRDHDLEEFLAGLYRTASSGVPGPPGPTGPQGATGPPGPAGASGGFYRFPQPTSAATWTINHGLPYRPNVAVVDSTGREVIPSTIDYPSDTQVVVTFSPALAGEAYLS